MNLKILLVLLFLFYLFPFTIVFAEDNLEFTAFELYPWGYYSKAKNNTKLTPKGIIQDWVTAIEDEAGLNINVRVVPYPRMLVSLKTGSSDCAVFFKNINAEKFSTRVTKIIDQHTVILASKESNIQSYEDLCRSRENGQCSVSIAHVRGNSVSERYDNDHRLNKNMRTNNNQLLKMLINGRVDAVASSLYSLILTVDNFEDQLKTRGIDTINWDGIYLTKKEAFWTCSNKSKHLDKIDKIKRAIQTLRGKGIFDQIALSYLRDLRLKVIYKTNKEKFDTYK